MSSDVNVTLQAPPKLSLSVAASSVSLRQASSPSVRLVLPSGAVTVSPTQPPALHLFLPDQQVELDLPDNHIDAIILAPQGVAGPPGAPGAGALVDRVAVGPQSALRALRFSGTQVENWDPFDVDSSYAGVSFTSCSLAGQTVSVGRDTEIQDGVWSWIPNKLVFAGAGGVLTQTSDPSWAVELAVGSAITAQRILLDPRTPIYR